MRDLSLNEFADSLREKLIDQGIELPKGVVRKMTRDFFRNVEKVAAEGKNRFMLERRPITAIYPLFDEHALCMELAEGKNVLTVDYLIRKNRLQKHVRRFYRRQKMTTE
jgi:predicted transcriptional regulator